MDSRLTACIPLAAAVVGWLLTPQSFPTELGHVPPTSSHLNATGWSGVPWPPAVVFSPEDRRRFELDGYIVLRDFLPRPIVRRLLGEHEKWCMRGASSPHWRCKNEDVWARTDTYRDFLYHGPLGKTVRDLLQVPGVRISGDHVTEMRADHSGAPYHFDGLRHGGVLGEFHARSRGAVALLFLTGVDPGTTGGSVLLQPGGHRDGCVLAGVEPALRRPCREAFRRRALALPFGAGDALILHPLMPRASQPPLAAAPPGLRRITYLARLVEGDAVFCGTDAQAREAGRVDCRHALRPGERAHHACYQQIDPLLEDEVKQRLGLDWYTATCNVQRGWRYSALKRLRLGVGTLVSQLRFRLNGGSPIALERAECVYSPEQLSMFG